MLVLGPKRAPEYTLRGLLGYYRQPAFLAFAVSLPSVRAPYTLLIFGGLYGGLYGRHTE